MNATPAEAGGEGGVGPIAGAQAHAAHTFDHRQPGAMAAEWRRRTIKVARRTARPSPDRQGPRKARRARGRGFAAGRRAWTRCSRNVTRAAGAWPPSTRGPLQTSTSAAPVRVAPAARQVMGSTKASTSRVPASTRPRSGARAIGNPRHTSRPHRTTAPIDSNSAQGRYRPDGNQALGHCRCGIRVIGLGRSLSSSMRLERRQVLAGEARGIDEAAHQRQRLAVEHLVDDLIRAQTVS